MTVAILIKIVGLLVCVNVKVCVTDTIREVTITINNGPIRGQESIDENGNVYYDFRGIPYAEPPVDNLRFKPPVPKLPWDGITLDATQDGPFCPQTSLFHGMQFAGAEDNCLTLNVYTPKLPSHNDGVKLDVVFHIHGGGFVGGAGGQDMLYHPKRIMQKDKNIIVVSLTYRVASIGFLSTSDEASPGNYGLLDQVEALRWVRNNIHHFGGDPRKVTILGESAGGGSVMYHLLSPLSKGLFHRAVAMSGTSLSPWAFQNDPVHWAKYLGSRVNCPETDSESLIRCLKSKSAQELTENDGILVNGVPRLHFVPTVDHNFIFDTPYNLIRDKKYNDVPLLIGVTRNEGNCWFRMSRPDSDTDFTDEEIDSSLRTLFNNPRNSDEAMRKVKAKYFSDMTSMKSEEVHRRLGQVVTDAYFHKYHYQTVQMMVERKSTVFVYSYDYVTEVEEFNELFKIKSSAEIGAYHGADLVNFFSSPVFMKPKQMEGDDLAVKEKMQKLFFNFVLTGNPNSDDVKVKWPQAKPDKLNVYHINLRSEVSVYDCSKDDLYKFWVDEIPATLEGNQPSSRDEL